MIANPFFLVEVRPCQTETETQTSRTSAHAWTPTVLTGAKTTFALFFFLPGRKKGICDQLSEDLPSGRVEHGFHIGRQGRATSRKRDGVIGGSWYTDTLPRISQQM